MKDSIGSTAMIYIFLIFLSIFITFIAVAFNYARAFRVKNEIINIIERNEGIDNPEDITGVRGQINSYLDEINYKIGKVDCTGFNYIDDDEYGYCIGKYNSDSSVRDETYYSVETFSVIRVPLINLSFPVKVRGETRTVVNNTDKSTTSSDYSSSSSTDTDIEPENDDCGQECWCLTEGGFLPSQVGSEECRSAYENHLRGM